MNFISIIIEGYLIVAVTIVFILLRDLKRLKNVSKNNNHYRFKHFYPFYGPGKVWAVSVIIILMIGIIVGIDSRFFEINHITIKNTEIQTISIQQPIKIAWLTDLQLGNHKKDAWLKKIINKLDNIKPDLILLGGDLIDNEGSYENESQYFEPLKKITNKYPIYYIMGNHEYGVGSASRGHPEWQTGDRSKDLMKKMDEIGIPLLLNQLECLNINNQSLCIFGVDDFWAKPIVFDDLKKWDQITPLIFITHNPDAVQFWPSNTNLPIITLAGHTHGGQVWLPIVKRPLLTAEVDLGFKYYRGLNYWNNIPIYTSTGLGESGGPVRFCALPEISVIELIPAN
ncbi:MAG: hypothetical protein COU29_01485 [Candidatus Magasanikbacteria bacterium CG10_big_fil_rev_8_21_14_0_10_36_32]|uniref:Calcineurin-like phosphoesterase domain-containing protein n=1 Tax=Candidatus Magasanikbacteria bacterium CG10_big_fil_rev_8_21_14_0_10_36_32 TaxID=1974646 RepID=A0A2M6W6M4_9BACT|nr:MAG: hypothetical protein COU29_01485 [Candidatus Magasanikbacteria bacterium CG10_big_fil_rev_8_21_14_0_10_36_32]